jgi:hypothetical protein
MTTVQINLPDQLAQMAQKAGLLTAEAIEAMLREQLRVQKVDSLFVAMDRMAATDTNLIVSPEELAKDIAVMRSELSAARQA